MLAFASTRCDPSVSLERRSCPCIEGYRCEEGVCVLGDGVVAAASPPGAGETPTQPATPAEAGPVDKACPCGDGFICEEGTCVPRAESPQYPFVVGQFADVDGDGKVDRIDRSTMNEFWVSLATASGFSQPRLWAKHGLPYAYDDQAKYADLDADGKADLIFQGIDNRFWVSISAGTGFKTPENWITHGPPYIVGQATYGDLNADERADLTVRGGDNRYWVSYSTGTGFTAPALRQ